jgi:RNA polymerase sigma factor (sigma-70 family)
MVERSKTQVTEFFASEWRRLSGWVRHRLDDEASREGTDLVGEVFATLFARDEDELPDNLAGYVYASLRHRIIDRFRARKPTVSLDAPLDEEGLTLADILPFSGEDAQQSFERQELLAALHQALEELDEPSRALVVATEFEDRTFRELSEEWQVPIGTLLSRKSRALRRLAALLSEYRP